MTCLIFGGEQFYPKGGVGDLIGAAPTWAAAIDIAKSRDLDWWQVLDLEDTEFCDSNGTREDIASLRGLRVTNACERTRCLKIVTDSLRGDIHPLVKIVLTRIAEEIAEEIGAP